MDGFGALRRVKTNKTRTATFVKTFWHLVLTLFCSTLFAVVIWYVQATHDAQRKSRDNQVLDDFAKADASTTVAVLRGSQGLLSGASAIALITSFQLIQWHMISRPKGISYLSWLSLSPASGLWGSFKVVAGPVSSASGRLLGLLK